MGICYAILAVLCFGYGIFIKAAKSGTNFYLVWLGLGALFVFAGCLVQFGIWGKVPLVIRRICYICICIGIAAFVIVEGLIISRMDEDGRKNLDYIIVLGAQVRETGPSVVLRYRLDRAITYLEENPDSICIVSGGQGKNEPFPEADGMADYLMKNGIDKERIILERKSKTTSENIKNSMEYMKKGAPVGIVTNSFHVYRALQIAKKEGLPDVDGIAAGSRAAYLPNNMLREFLAEIKFMIMK